MKIQILESAVSLISVDLGAARFCLEGQTFGCFCTLYYDGCVFELDVLTNREDSDDILNEVEVRWGWIESREGDEIEGREFADGAQGIAFDVA